MIYSKISKAFFFSSNLLRYTFANAYDSNTNTAANYINGKKIYC